VSSDGRTRTSSDAKNNCRPSRVTAPRRPSRPTGRRRAGHPGGALPGDQPPPDPPFRWDPDRRALIRAELDADDARHRARRRLWRLPQSSARCSSAATRSWQPRLSSGSSVPATSSDPRTVRAVLDRLARARTSAKRSTAPDARASRCAGHQRLCALREREPDVQTVREELAFTPRHAHPCKYLSTEPPQPGLAHISARYYNGKKGPNPAASSVRTDCSPPRCEPASPATGSRASRTVQRAAAEMIDALRECSSSIRFPPDAPVRPRARHSFAAPTTCRRFTPATARPSVRPKREHTHGAT
jgi:hypothetical protein